MSICQPNRVVRARLSSALSLAVPVALMLATLHGPAFAARKATSAPTSAASAPAPTTSFDCAKAVSWAERAICIEPSLGALDIKLAASFNSALARSPQPAVLRSEQMNWLRSRRDTCTHATCIKEVYAARMRELEPGSKDTRAPLVAAGKYRRYRFGKIDPQAAQLQIKALGNEEYALTGDASWSSGGAGPNVGQIEGRIAPKSGLAEYVDGACRMKLLFAPGLISVRESTPACGGLNVSFDGDYRRVKK